MQVASTQILMIEDDDQDVEMVQHFLDDMPIVPFTLKHRNTLSGGINMLQDSEAIDLILLDLSLPDAHGLDTFHQVHQAFPQKPLIILSGNSDPTVADEALQEGAQDFLVKGDFDSTSLCFSIQHALELQKHRVELELQDTTINALSKQLEIARREIEKLATLDSLTSVLNRNGFDEVCLSEWKRLQREQKRLSLILCEIDPIEGKNNCPSQAWKDNCLQQIAKAMTKVAKRPGDCVARCSENQFAILLPHTDILGATLIAESIRTEIHGLSMNYSSGLHCLPITLSYGVTSHIPTTNDSPSLLLEAANQALAGARRQGQNRVFWQTIGDVNTDLYTYQTLYWVGRLHQALLSDQFQLYAQPIHSLKGQPEIKGYEILLRLNDQQGISSPGMFLPMVKQYDFMTQIDQWVIEHLLRALSKRQAKNQDKSSFFITLSAATCKSGRISDYIQQQLSRYDFPAERVTFLISETTALKHLSKTTTLCNSLKALGCHIALNDCGSDISAFSQLRTIGANYVKIDGSLVEGITTDPVIQEIVASIQEVAKVMKMQTIAEQVESYSTLKALSELGIDYAQGHCYERATPLKQILT
ncbi:EAL domain-containing protein [Acaryochloris marina]|uniref:EAL domain-containing response regulator n=1 Tax=Acaryochloris marina TaxID=155978 RepID=UPI001BB0ABDD|nr:EAL domain-containing protein [Acaryochloris marina]QUY45888.1 EAL domain-containing protein [Acaryochloris marina S15]